MSLTLTKITETSATITLGWEPPANVGGYVFYAAGQAVAQGSQNFKDGSPRNTVKFSKSTPGPPFQVAALCRSGSGAGTFSVEVGTYPPSPGVVFPGPDVYPSEVSP